MHSAPRARETGPYGLWQVSIARMATSRCRRRWILYYVRNWSLCWICIFWPAPLVRFCFPGALLRSLDPENGNEDHGASVLQAEGPRFELATAHHPTASCAHT